MAQEIEHTHLPIRGLNLHVAQVGKGELGTVVFLHGFPEICVLVLMTQEPGRAEADFGRYDVRRVVRTVYVLFSGAEIPTANECQEIMDLADLSTPLPESFHRRPNQMNAKFQVPVFMVMGEKDYAFKFPGLEAAVRGGAMENFAPDLKITYIPEGSHFVQEQLPEQVNQLLLGFLKDRA
ncbi:hypothetical protein EJB05_23852 [Eragrostis curvula]|uniref:AB hydrolase-1 domain-containing protein n=1 Tax=Eragrostis curvula TaxID=38414 RepID=A0A5J9V7Z5_9POAL|nr:hypothetical protein EJB05_23852 [Eragrostis curvula]